MEDMNDTYLSENYRRAEQFATAARVPDDLQLSLSDLWEELDNNNIIIDEFHYSEAVQCPTNEIAAEVRDEMRCPNSPCIPVENTDCDHDHQLKFMQCPSPPITMEFINCGSPNSPTALQELLFSNVSANTTVEPTITNSVSEVVSSDSSVVNLLERPEPEVGRNYGRRPQSRVGRWTKQEQKLFDRGLNKYGKGNWKDIAELVRTRTPIQVGSHAQKYFKHHENRRDWKSCSSRSSIFESTTVKTPTVQPPSQPSSLPQQQFTVTNYYPPPDHQRS